MAYSDVIENLKLAADNLADISKKIRNIADNQTKIQFTEFLTICVSKEYIFTKKNLETAFKMIDKVTNIFIKVNDCQYNIILNRIKTTPCHK